ncbi:MAG TPA: osmotically inducible protein C [Chloroflexi bacterium]|nr:osmotically inducible protein C [Chloroflexota bacterium]HHW87063.1 OsmC family protein [Chloroflexota bacterium]
MLEYTVEAEQVVPNVATARAKRAQIFFDSSPGQSEHLLNPAELLLSAFSACLLKNVERLAPILRFSYTRAAIRVHGVREDKPPRLVRIDWELTIWTDEPAARVDLLERNLRKQGTIYNTLAAACAVEGRVIPLPPTAYPPTPITATPGASEEEA